jgi:ubiquinone/menaquinone biosynthesis C-methylase UbiE
MALGLLQHQEHDSVKKFGRYEFKYYTRILHCLFRTHAKGAGCVLDDGCGKGEWLDYLKEGTLAVGIDIEPTNIDEARALFAKTHQFLVADARYLPFRGNSFDLILCRDVLEHVTDKARALTELARTLQEGGTVLISTTNLLSPIMLLDSLLPSVVSRKLISNLGGEHYHDRARRFSSWSLIKSLRQQGLRTSVTMLRVPPPLGENLASRFTFSSCIIYYAWYSFGRISEARFLEKFKEMILVEARKLDGTR